MTVPEPQRDGLLRSRSPLPSPPYLLQKMEDLETINQQTRLFFTLNLMVLQLGELQKHYKPKHSLPEKGERAAGLTGPASPQLHQWRCRTTPPAATCHLADVPHKPPQLFIWHFSV